MMRAEEECLGLSAGWSTFQFALNQQTAQAQKNEIESEPYFSLCNSFLLHSLFIPEQIWQNLEGSIFQMSLSPHKKQQKSEPDTVSQFGFRNRAGTLSVKKKKI